jgi:hypothetical protein
MSDGELLQAIAAGSEPAFEELRRRYSGAVGAVCRTVTGSEREDGSIVRTISGLAADPMRSPTSSDARY